MNSDTSSNSRYTEAKRTYATLSSSFKRRMIISPILLVGRSRSGDSCTYFSIALTMLSSLVDGTGRFSQARSKPAMTLLRSKVSLRPSFLTTMYGISSMRSYDVNRRSQRRHSRRRRIASPSRDSRESTTLSSRYAQNGHFILVRSFPGIHVEKSWLAAWPRSGRRVSHKRFQKEVLDQNRRDAKRSKAPRPCFSERRETAVRRQSQREKRRQRRRVSVRVNRRATSRARRSFQ